MRSRFLLACCGHTILGEKNCGPSCGGVANDTTLDLHDGATACLLRQRLLNITTYSVGHIPLQINVKGKGRIWVIHGVTGSRIWSSRCEAPSEGVDFHNFPLH